MKNATMICVLIGCLLIGTPAGQADPFFNPIPGPGGDGSYDPGYTPTFSMFFTGSLYTIDTDGDGLGDDGIVAFGDRNMTSLGGNAVNPATSLRAFNVMGKNGTPDGETAAPIVNNDPFPSWNPDTPDADPGWVAAFSGSERYGFDIALGAGKAISGLPVTEDWAVTLYPWAPGAGAGAVVRPYSGTVGAFSANFVGDGTGGVTDQMITETQLLEADGTWNIDFNDDGTDDEVIQLQFATFLADSTLYEVGNMFAIPDPLGGPGTWTFNEWSSIDPDTGIQGLNPITPVPEPGTAALLAVGGLALLPRRNRRA